MWLIDIGCHYMSWVRRQQRSGSRTAAMLAIALGGVMIAWELDWPAHYWKTWWGHGVLVTLTVLTGISTLLVVFGYQKLLDRDKKRATLLEAAEGFARLVEDETSMQKGEYGVNIWLIRGPLGFRRLVRGPSITPPHDSTPIVWTKGKGAIGQAWKRKRDRFADLDTLRENYPTQESWCRRSKEARFRLGWDEFADTERYRAVVAVPLRVARFVRYPVRGVVAIDALVPGKAGELEALTKSPGFDAVMKTCQTAFIPDEGNQ